MTAAQDSGAASAPLRAGGFHGATPLQPSPARAAVFLVQWCRVCASDFVPTRPHQRVCVGCKPLAVQP
jgi:hypothetical protein